MSIANSSGYIFHMVNILWYNLDLLQIVSSYIAQPASI